MEIKLKNTQRALSPTGIDIADRVINPYIGCQFGCEFCYSRANKRIKRIKKKWGDFVWVKGNFVDILNQELRDSNKKIKRVLIGSTTDPLQPVEKKYRLTESVLKVLREYNIPVTLLTRSLLVERYIDLLGYSPKNSVYFTYNPKVTEIFTKGNNFCIKDKKRVIKKLYFSNINLFVYISPVFPEIVDVEKIFKELKGRTGKIYFENYNIKVGNWNRLKNHLNDDYMKKIENIFLNKEKYDKYWKNFVRDTDALNQNYGYDLKFIIYPFNSYYQSKI
ncbi:MAG: radical SAM protein [Atribacterota bacterium]